MKRTPIFALPFLGRENQQRGLEVRCSLEAKFNDPLLNYTFPSVQKYTLLCTVID